MVLKRRFNCVHKEYPPYRTGDPVGILNGCEEPDLLPWLGIIDRHAARRIAGAQQVFLDFCAFQLTLLDRTHWLNGAQAVVGCRVEEGVLGVTDGKVPLLKPLPTELAQKSPR